MITCNLMGGLGNQMFQIFATISYGIKSKNQFKFFNLKTLGGGETTIRNTFWDSFFHRLKPFLIDVVIPEDTIVIREKDFSFNELPIHEMIGKNCLILGYFQSYKYFDENYEMITRIIQLKKMKEYVIKQINLDNEYLNKCISMHFRIGDYKNLQDFHPLTTYEYYLNALNLIQNMTNEKYNILYFCENSDIYDVMKIINKLKQSFPKYQFIRANEKLEDWEQLLLMSCCHHNIIANSSFSWWGAYFNSRHDKIVCYPSVWFNEVIKKDTKDLCPDDWIKIKC